MSCSERRKLPALVAAGAILVLAVCYVLLAWRHSETVRCSPNFDYYGYFYPNILYALESLQKGEGVFWNRFQNCGQPFFATSLTALLYPPHLVFLIFYPGHALAALVMLHLVIAGIGTYWLCRELKLDTAAALCGAFAFEFGGVTLFIAGWTLIVMIRRGHERTGIGEYLHSLGQRPRNRALLDLLGARYWVLSTLQDLDWVTRADGVKLVWNRGRIRVYENLHALPRVYFVPRAREIGDPAKTMSLLSSLENSPRDMVLLDRLPAHYSLQDNTPGRGRAAIVSDESESLAIDVSASTNGFVVVTDQYDPGWSASVNGRPVEILRANYAFKAVPVPAGKSEVLLKYRPRGLSFGILSTAATIVVAAALTGFGLLNRENNA